MCGGGGGGGDDKRDSTRHLSMDKLKFIWYQNRYKMVHFTKEIMMLLRASLAVMWFPLWMCLFNMHFSVQCTRCRWPGGIQFEKSSLAIMCCLPHQKVQFRYKYTEMCVCVWFSIKFANYVRSLQISSNPNPNASWSTGKHFCDMNKIHGTILQAKVTEILPSEWIYAIRIANAIYNSI